MSSSAADGTRYYVYDGDLVIGEVLYTGGSYVPDVAYTWGANGLVSERFLTGTPYSLWYHFGPQGETRYLTNMPVPPNPAAIVDTYLYTAYGEPVASSGTDRNPFRYGGQVGYYTGPGAGIILCGARWYNPYTARWMTRDPIGYAGGENLYAYCGENPTNATDATGLNALILCGKDNEGGKADTGFFLRIGKVWATKYDSMHSGFLGLGQYFSPEPLPMAFVESVGTVEDVKRALARTPDIDTLLYFGHAGSDALYLRGGRNLYPPDVGSLPTRNLVPGARIGLFGCHTAEESCHPDTVDITQAFADRFGATATGVSGGLSFGAPWLGVDWSPGSRRPGNGLVSTAPGRALGRWQSKHVRKPGRAGLGR